MPIALVMSSAAKLETLPSPGSRLVTTDGRELPLEGAQIRAEAGGGIARTVVEQRFRNPHAEPLTVTYSLPLPADGAVSGFAFTIGDRRIKGRVEKRDDARRTFEQAIFEGRSAALLEQDRSSLFTQEIGNIPPGATIVAEITVDQPLRWLDEGAWEWRFPTVVAPRYMGAAGRVADAERIVQDVADGPIGARFTLECAIADELSPERKPESPSHAMSLVTEGQPPSYRDNASSRDGTAKSGARRDGTGRITTMRIEQGARLDRDVVVRWTVATPSVGLALSVGRPPAGSAASEAGYGLLTIVPPARGAQVSAVTRDVIVLLDTSGSMGGEPLEQARRVIAALIGTLGERDRLEMIEFSSRARRWRRGPEKATEAVKREALSWLRGLSAGGGTEMRTGILEALGTLRQDAQRQVVVVTDGQIGFETEVIAAICDKLPVSSRLHTVGVGSAVNRSLTGPAARAGRGIEAIIGLGEDPERAAAKLLSRTDAPIVVNLAIQGSAVIGHAPRRLPDLFAGAPVLVGLALRPEGGEILVRGRTATGTWEQRLSVGPIGAGTGNTAAPALYGREAIEDAELAIAAGGHRWSLDGDIESAGLKFQLATRLTSWVAVTEDVTVDPEAARRRQRMPHELPFGMSAEGVGLRGAEERAGAGAGGELLAELGALGSDDARVTFSLGEMLAGRASAGGPAPAKKMTKIDLKARLGKTTIGAAEPASAPKPAAPPSRTIRVELPPEELPQRARKTSFLGPWSLLVLLAFGLAYYFSRSFPVAFGVAAAVTLVSLAVRRLLR